MARRASSDTRRKKASLYIPAEVLMEVSREAERQERSLSWMFQQAWQRARSTFEQLPLPR